MPSRIDQSEIFAAAAAVRERGARRALLSPLTFSLLPRIKELGLESFVLGVSTPFYNELLEIYWKRRGDLLGMMGLHSSGLLRLRSE